MFFVFLANCYATASDEVRRRLIDAVLEGPRGEEFNGLEPAAKDYEILQFHVWLSRIAPLCAITHARLQEIQAKHQEFKPPEHPELDFWSEEVETGALGTEFDIDLIASQPASEFLDRAL